MTRTFANRRAISMVLSVLRLSTTTTSRAHANCASVRPMFASSSRVRIRGVMRSSIDGAWYQRLCDTGSMAKEPGRRDLTAIVLVSYAWFALLILAFDSYPSRVLHCGDNPSY